MIKETWSFLDKRHRAFFVLIVLGSLVQAFLELLGVSVVIPLIDLIEDTSSIQTKWYLRLLYSMFPFDSTNDFLISLVVIIMVLYIFKACYSIFMNWATNRFSSTFGARLGARLFNVYVRMPYSFHKTCTTSDIINNCNWGVNSVSTALSALLGIIGSSIVGLAILVFLFIENPLIASIVFGALIIVSFFATYLSRRKLKKIGTEMGDIYRQQYALSQESLESIKEAKIYGLESFYTAQYESSRFETAFRNTNYNVIGSLPKVIVEAFGMISMLAAILVVVLMGTSSKDIVTTFSVFAVAVIKLLPYVSSLSGNISALNFNVAGVDKVKNALELEAQEEKPIRDQSGYPFTSQILFDHVSFAYADDDRFILEDASVKIVPGESVAFFGPSGMGKTTTIDLLLGLLSPTKGSITVDGKNIAEAPSSWRDTISYVPQTVFLSDGTIKENVTLGIPEAKIDEEKLQRVLQQAALTDFIAELPHGIDTKVGEAGSRLSGGQKQRIGIARALYRDRPILVLDEATAALDFDTEKKILSSVCNLRGNKTLIVITHRIGTIEGFDNIYEVTNGKIVAKK